MFNKTIEIMDRITRLERQLHKLEQILEYSKPGEVVHVSYEEADPFLDTYYRRTQIYKDNQQYIIEGLYLPDSSTLESTCGDMILYKNADDTTTLIDLEKLVFLNFAKGGYPKLWDES